MRERKWYLVVAFSSTSQAMAFEKVAKARDYKGRMIPLPGVISAGCGLAWRDALEAKEKLETMAEEMDLKIQGIYTLLL